MTGKQVAAGSAGAAGVALALWLGLTGVGTKPPTDHKIPKDKISGMLFPKGMKIAGDPQTHKTCHQIIMRHADGTEEVLAFHTIDRDLTGLSEDQIKALVIEHTQGDLEQEGMACNDTPPGIFPEAVADVKRCDECGSGCWITSCPATSHPTYCTLAGTTCVISFICCGGQGCPASCDA